MCSTDSVISPFPSGPNKHQSAVTCLQFCRGLVLSSSDDGTVKLWDLRTGAWLRDVVALQSRGSGQHLHHVHVLSHTWYFRLLDSRKTSDAFVEVSPNDTCPFSTGGVVWRIRASDTRLVCAAGSRNGTEETKLLVLDFDLDDRKKETDWGEQSDVIRLRQKQWPERRFGRLFFTWKSKLLDQIPGWIYFL